MKTQIIKFHDTQLLGYQDDKGTIWVAVKPICEGIGLNAQQLRKDEILTRVGALKHLHDTSNRLQEMLCLPLDYVSGWLFTIQVSRVNPEVKPVLIAYKLECHKILFNHFYKKWQVDAKPSRLAEIEQRLAQVQLLPFPDDDDAAEANTNNTPLIPTQIDMLLLDVKNYKREISYISRRIKDTYKEIEDLL